MNLYVIHNSPSDYPGRIVVRRLRVTAKRSLVYARPHAVTWSKVPEQLRDEVELAFRREHRCPGLLECPWWPR